MGRTGELVPLDPAAHGASLAQDTIGEAGAGCGSTCLKDHFPIARPSTFISRKSRLPQIRCFLPLWIHDREARWAMPPSCESNLSTG